MSDRIVSQPSSDAYRANWERIWGKRDAADHNSPLYFDGMRVGMRVMCDSRVPKNEIWQVSRDFINVISNIGDASNRSRD